MWGRPEGLGRLDLSLEGFWRSFGAIGLIIPSVIVALLAQRAAVATTGEPLQPLSAAAVGANAAALLIDWLAFPALFALLAKPLGVATRYVPFIVARNWAAVSVAAIGTALNAVGTLSFMPIALTSALLVMAMAATIWFSFNIARTALAAPAGLAIPIVVIDFLLSLTIWSLVAPAAQSGG